MQTSHYVYLAIGLDKRYLIWLYRFNLPVLQLYIGVRTGILPDNGYKTSSKNKQWLYLCKFPLALFETREQANEAETELLKICKEAGISLLLANIAIKGVPCMLNFKMPASFIAKRAKKMQGKRMARQGWIAKMQANMPITLLSPKGERFIFSNALALSIFIDLHLAQFDIYMFTGILAGKRQSAYGWRVMQ